VTEAMLLNKLSENKPLEIARPWFLDGRFIFSFFLDEIKKQKKF
jgi:hypothetical protein